MVLELKNPLDLERILQRSHHSPVVIFKHSTQCSRSAAALAEYKEFEAQNSSVPCGLLLVIEDRALSNAVEDQFGIEHESPQAIVVVNGVPVWNAAHWKITRTALQDAIGKAEQCPTV